MPKMRSTTGAVAASESTRQEDYTGKRDDCAAFGIPEYWRFDPSGGRHHGAPLAGDRLAEGTYQPIDILETAPDHLYGHSDALNLDLCWEKGKLMWWDPATRRYLPTFDEESDARIAEAEARVRELEAELERRRGG